MHYKKYHWLHIESGKTGEKEFTESHYAESGCDRFEFRQGIGIPALQAFALVNKWNASSVTFKYWI